MRRSNLPAVLLALFALLPWAQAQDATDRKVNPAAFNTAFEQTVIDDLQHGKQLRITFFDSEQAPIEGTLVRFDAKTDRLFVRIEPGAPPHAIAKGDIQNIEKRIRFPVANNGIRLAVAASVDVRSDEIQVIEVVNGTQRSVTYHAPALSPGERAQLSNLETAENDAARLGYLAERENQVLDNAIAIQTEQRKSQELLTLFLARQSPWGHEGWAAGVWPGVVQPWARYVQGYAAPLPPTQIVIPKLAVQTDALAAARQRLLVAQSHAVFERGQLVAVIASDVE